MINGFTIYMRADMLIANHIELAKDMIEAINLIYVGQPKFRKAAGKYIEQLVSFAL